MSTQYYRNASAHPHYHDFPANNQEHLYALAASPWQQDPNHTAYTGAPSAPFVHYSQGGHDAFPVASPAPTPTWPAGYARPKSRGWLQPAVDASFASRTALPYDCAEGVAPVLDPRPQPQSSQDYRQQQITDTAPTLAISDPRNAYRSIGRTQDLQTPTESPAHSVGPSFPTHAHEAHEASAITSHSASRSADTASLRPTSTGAPVQPTTHDVWARPGAPLIEHQPYPGPTSNTLVSDRSPVHETGHAGTPWPIRNDDVPSSSSAYGQAQVEQQWEVAQRQDDRGYYGQQTHYQQPTSSSAQGPRRSSVKKKVVKVPSSFVERQEKLKVSRRKGPLQERQREKTHTMRKTKRICVRCRFYKSGCDEGDPCEKCQKITGHARSFREPCYREHLEDTSLVRRCNGREHQEEAEFLRYDWVKNSQLYEMEIMWNLPGYGQIPSAQPIRVTFRPYSPRRGSLDVAASLWTNKDGELKAVEQPAYAIYDTANLVPAFERYFSSLQPAIEAWIFTRISQDEVASLTYAEVLRMRSVHSSRALDLAMRLQCLSVVSQGYGSVWSNNIPGIQEYDYRRLGSSDYEAYNRRHNDRPLPGAITHQMDVAAVKYLKKLEKAFVKELAALIFKPKIKPWYELFLAFYVIFWNLEYIHHGAHDYMKSKNGTLIENQVNNVVKTQVKKWEFAFPVLLYHWRCTLRGYSPFKMARENPEELQEKGHIDHEGYEYVRKIASLFDRTNPDRFQPPLTGFAAAHYSISSEWIVNLFREAGA